MLEKLDKIATHQFYWLVLALLALMLEATALFYQYALNYYPCVLCIHVRIWVMFIFIISLLALKLRQNRFGLVSMHLLMTVCWAGMLERSYQLLGTERGFVEGSCSMKSGLPSWFALDEWFPLVFQVQDACGYTPKLFFGITMAEALIVLSFVLFVLSLVLLSRGLIGFLQSR